MCLGTALLASDAFSNVKTHSHQCKCFLREKNRTGLFEQGVQI